jgi:hypothetical protein
MPQFDTFSFFSQLFWVFLAFSYLYLALSYYLLPAFATVLKLRAKKLAQTDVSSDTSVIATSSTTNSAFFDNLSTKLVGISAVRNDLTNDINATYAPLLVKNEAYYQFNFLILTQLKLITFFN